MLTFPSPGAVIPLKLCVLGGEKGGKALLGCLLLGVVSTLFRILVSLFHHHIILFYVFHFAIQSVTDTNSGELSERCCYYREVVQAFGMSCIFGKPVFTLEMRCSTCYPWGKYILIHKVYSQRTNCFKQLHKSYSGSFFLLLRLKKELKYLTI